MSDIKRIVLVVNQEINYNRVSRFVARSSKITGLIEDDLGVRVTIDSGNGYPAQTIYVENSFDEVAEFMIK